jgi:hypothetical protein
VIFQNNAITANKYVIKLMRLGTSQYKYGNTKYSKGKHFSPPLVCRRMISLLRRSAAQNQVLKTDTYR